MLEALQFEILKWLAPGNPLKFNGRSEGSSNARALPGQDFLPGVHSKSGTGFGARRGAPSAIEQIESVPICRLRRTQGRWSGSGPPSCFRPRLRKA